MHNPDEDSGKLQDIVSDEGLNTSFLSNLSDNLNSDSMVDSRRESRTSPMSRRESLSSAAGRNRLSRNDRASSRDWESISFVSCHDSEHMEM